MTDTQHQLIEEAVKRFDEFMTDVQINAYDHKTDRHDFSYIESSVKAFLTQELSLIARKSGEEEVKDFARAVIEGGFVDETDFNYFLEEYIEEVYPEALSNPKEL